MKISCFIFFLAFLGPVWAVEEEEALPKKIALKLSIKDLVTVAFTLLKQDSVDDDSIQVVTTTDKHWHSKENQTIGNYKNKRGSAIISVKVVERDGKLKRKYFGSFVLGDDTFSLKPADENIIEGALASYEVDIDGVDHVVSETKDKINFESTSQEKRMSENRKFRSRFRRQSGYGKTSLVVEVLCVVDYSIYRRWLAYSSNNRQKAVSNLMAYYSHVFSSIDTKYRTIQSPSYLYSIKLTGIYITETSADSFTEVPRVKSGANLDYGLALNELQSWAAKKGSILPSHDIITSFTKYRSTGTNTGLAYEATTCQKRGVSISMDTGVYGTADIAAHEIGHNLGAKHDGEGNRCNPEDQFLMTASHDPSPISNLHTFSSCSINYFDRNSAKASSECLQINGVHMDTSVHTRTKLGTMYTLDEQCRHEKGPNSYFCSKGKRSDGKICEVITCYDYGRKECTMSASSRALEGTSCGNKKWCMNKQCVYDAQAPDNKDECVHGDFKDSISFGGVPLECKDLNEKKSACGSSTVAELCCEACEKIAKANPGCPTGDFYSNCEELKVTCGDEQRRKTCCETCETVKTDSPTCPYGDSYPNCKDLTNQCETEDIGKKCCQSCEAVRKKNPASCPYGDFYPNCATLIRHCETQDIGKRCCKTCAEAKRRNPADCPYGDKYGDCAMHTQRCNQDSIRKGCCATCRFMNG